MAGLSMHLHSSEHDNAFTRTCTRKTFQAVQSNSTSAILLPHLIASSRHSQDQPQSLAGDSNRLHVITPSSETMDM